MKGEEEEEEEVLVVVVVVGDGQYNKELGTPCSLPFLPLSLVPTLVNLIHAIIVFE